MNSHLTMYILSDSIGETGEFIARAAIRQFMSDNYEIKKFPFISGKDRIKDIMEDAARSFSIVLYTTVSLENKSYIEEMGKKYNIPTVDIMTPPIEALEKILQFPPKREPGLIRRLDENYFKKVEAVEFTVKYDDGKDPRGVKKADICLVGVSRTSKTPLSMYLAHKNYKVANIPLVPEVPAPREIFEKDVRRVIGLVTDPEKLIEIRKERLKALGLDFTANYANVDRIKQELEYSRGIMERLGCIVIDVSQKAIEETAAIIIEYMNKNFGDNII
ncbi:kinase/pyrophosphorylase [Tissierella creatinini]|nr:kinase/pyrophosphorylase [Tissierella creatinini]TJX67157.1 kinase/pyrophosphorylase [Soehngenia saccharolytica]